MQHVAIDLGSRESQVCIRTSDGTIVEEKKHPTRSLGDWMKQWPTSRVIMETSSEAFRVADAARAAGHEVRVVRSTLAKQLGIGDRGIKTDIRDARTLSLLSCRTDVESVHIPTEERLDGPLDVREGGSELMGDRRNELVLQSAHLGLVRERAL